ncbi:hypothetical protein WV31_02830 [Magnetospirillum sp. ME-1]|uniref:hypothetical protein n=1 Tax=Magnetospirillum sp. ME-1 TaxID=1639348 RepID=UPI000A17F70F|nr:hypothetical protein [Magnetospirillum sp. ME-1]ARJ64679.1 hypothetical protein WV31_02830 [Magnetospirillum sp. ME-1]
MTNLDTANTTTTPWHRPQPDNHIGRITSPSAPATPPKATEVEAHNRWHHAVAIARNDALADCVIALRTHLDALTDGSISPEAWDACRHAVRGAIGPGAGCNDLLRLELARVIEGPDKHGGFQIGCPAEVEGLPLQRRMIVEVRKANGEDAGDNANLIAGLLSKAVGLLSSSMAKVMALRQIAQTTLVLDADYAAEFDRHDWADDDGDIRDRKTGMALGDLLLGLDGMWCSAPAQTSDGFLLPRGALDFRRHRLQINRRARPVEISVPPEVLSKLQVAATEFGGDLGRTVAQRFA